MKSILRITEAQLHKGRLDRVCCAGCRKKECTTFFLVCKLLFKLTDLKSQVQAPIDCPVMFFVQTVKIMACGIMWLEGALR